MTIDFTVLREKLRGVAVFLAIVWGVFLAEIASRFYLAQWGVTPRTLRGLVGIVSMPFLHGGFWHLLGNTFPLAALLALLVISRNRPWTIVAALIVCGGALLWLVGCPSVHIGASGLIMGLIAFLIGVGFSRAQGRVADRGRFGSLLLRQCHVLDGLFLSRCRNIVGRAPVRGRWRGTGVLPVDPAGRGRVAGAACFAWRGMAGFGGNKCKRRPAAKTKSTLAR